LELNNANLLSLLHPRSKSLIQQSYFDVRNESVGKQLLSWRERMGGVLDVLPSLIQTEQPFEASVTRYTVGDLSFSDLYSDPLRVERSLARISVDRACNFFLFAVCVEGDSHTMEGKYSKRNTPARPKILALDLDQPLRMQGHRHRFSTFFVPRAMVESIVPDADSLHARAIDDSTPLARFLIKNTAMLNQEIASMSVEDASCALRSTIQLLATAFGKQAKLCGGTRAALRAIMFNRARGYIKAHLDDPELGAEKLLHALQLPRDTLYRMFEHEGGIASYICDLRLRTASNDIVKFPNLAIKDIAYGVGFNSASAFSRAFRRVYGLTPQDLRTHVASHIEIVHGTSLFRGARTFPPNVTQLARNLGVTKV
jgi:AraC-like DNA-binding protein